MLKGWTLTDLHCDICRVTPLMREPPVSAERLGRLRIQFCALCDGGPAGPAAPTALAASSATPTPNVDAGPGPSTNLDNTANTISTLLLKGYSLLATNCPNTSCRGIPLVGYPRKKDGSKDSRRMCVSCEGRWVQEDDLGGMKLMRREEVSAEKRQVETEGRESPRTRRRREMYGIGEEDLGGQVKLDMIVSNGNHEEIEEEIEGMEVDAEKPSQADALSTALQHTKSSLSLTLDRLAVSLERHTTGTSKADETRYFVDVKLHTEAMKDILEVLGMAERCAR